MEEGEPARTIYSFDVAISDHDSLKQGIVVREWHTVTVSAESESDAHLCALQMAACFGMPTELRWRL